MATIYIENQSYEFEGEGRNVLDVCLSLGFDLPYFCWHPAMHSVGACRQCAVKQFKDENDAQGRIVMACMTAAHDGMRISIKDPEAVAFRAGVIEWLMTSHPHDCPVCDEGGECHLQDMTVMTGHVYRRYRFTKRTHRNQYLGPFVNHEMNRCIQCYRCVRFYRDYAGGRDLNVFGWHDRVYFGRFADGVLESEFSGNLVEICPTGVFTDKTLKQHYTRKWDLQTAPSVCVHCGLGCNTIPGERYDTLRRIRARFNGEVNGYFLCNRGRYGYEFVNHESRLYEAQRNVEGGLQPLAVDRAVEDVKEWLRTGHVIGIGSARASLEANFALQELVGFDNFYHGMCDSDYRLLTLMVECLRHGPAPAASLQEAGKAHAVLVLGEDVTNAAPMLALSLRQATRQAPLAELAGNPNFPVYQDEAVRTAIQDRHGPLFVATPAATRLDELASATHRAAPADLARLAFAIAHEIDERAPTGEDLSEEARGLARQIAAALTNHPDPLVVVGTSCGSEALMLGAANIAWALRHTGHSARLCGVVPECNSLGLSLLGGKSLGQAVEVVAERRVDTIVVLENDLYRHMDTADADALLGGAGHVIVIDHLPTETANRADVVLPAATFAESTGTLINNEGRAQRFFQVYTPHGATQPSWRWLARMREVRDGENGQAWSNLDDLLADLAETRPVFAAVPKAAPLAHFRMAGQRVPRQSHRYSGRTAISANLDVSEPKPPQDSDAPLSFTMEGYPGQPPGALISRFWAPGWDSPQAINKFQNEVGGPLRGGDPGVRLIGSDTEEVTYHREIPASFTPAEGEVLLLWAYHIFGSEELSVLSPGIAALAPQQAYLALNPEDAAALNVSEGAEVEFSAGKTWRTLPVALKPELPRGVAMLPAGFPATRGICLPAASRLRPVSHSKAVREQS